MQYRIKRRIFIALYCVTVDYVEQQCAPAVKTSKKSEFVNSTANSCSIPHERNHRTIQRYLTQQQIAAVELTRLCLLRTHIDTSLFHFGIGETMNLATLSTKRATDKPAREPSLERHKPINIIILCLKTDEEAAIDLIHYFLCTCQT